MWHSFVILHQDASDVDVNEKKSSWMETSSFSLFVLDGATLSPKHASLEDGLKYGAVTMI